MLTAQHISEDPHARLYAGQMDLYPEAAQAVLSILNDPLNEQRMVDVELLYERPALAGIVREIEANADIAPVLDSGPAALRFRQFVGVAVRLKMEQMGWRKTGTKGAVTGSSRFTKAERYAPPV